MSDLADFTPWIAVLGLISPVVMGFLLYALPGFRKNQFKSDKNAVDLEYMDKWKEDINKKIDQMITAVNILDKNYSLLDLRTKIIENEHMREQEDRNRIHDRDRDNDKDNKNKGFS